MFLFFVKMDIYNKLLNEGGAIKRLYEFGKNLIIGPSVLAPRPMPIGWEYQ